MSKSNDRGVNICSVDFRCPKLYKVAIFGKVEEFHENGPETNKSETIVNISNDEPDNENVRVVRFGKVEEINDIEFRKNVLIDQYPIESLFGISRVFVKVQGIYRLLKAVIFLQQDRVIKLISEYKKNGKTEELYTTFYPFNNNILHIICSSYTENYLRHKDNFLLFDRIFLLILEMVPDIHKFFVKNTFHRTPIEQAIYSSKYHYAIALMNFGAKIKPEDYKTKTSYGFDDLKILSLKPYRGHDVNLRFSCKLITGFFANQIFSSIRPPGRILLDMCHVCEITKKKNLTNPIVMDNGCVYEFEDLRMLIDNETFRYNLVVVAKSRIGYLVKSNKFFYCNLIFTQ